MIETSLFVWLEHFDGDALNYWAELEQGVQRDGSIKDVEFKITNQEEIFYVSVNASLIEQVANEERGFILSIWRDITQSKKSEQSLYDEKIFTETALNSQRDTFFIFDPSIGKALRWNTAFSESNGYTDEEISSLKAPDSYYSNEDLERAAEAIRVTLEKGKAIVEISLITKDGRSIPFEYLASIIKDSKGNPRYIVVIGRNITERKEAEKKILESEKNFRTIFEAIPDLYFLLSGDTTILEWNGKYEDLYLQPGDFLGKKIIEIFPANLSQLFNASINITLKTKNPQTVEYQLLLGENYRSFETRHFYFSIDKVAVFIRDITERKVFEQKLKESEKNFREAYNRADFYKNIVIHDMSNVLQNLITSVELFSLSSEKTKEMKNLRDQIVLIKNSVNRGIKLILNVRKLSRLEDVGVSIKSIEICKILEESVSYLRKSFPDKEIIIKIDAPSKTLFVNANELLLDVFENILNNATKYNENSIVLIFISIYKERRQNISYIRVDFKDNGIGITDDKKNSIFQKGFKKEKKIKGMGIGLSLVSKIIEGYNGNIWVEDKVKGDYTKGSNFIVLIPEFAE